MRTNIPSLPTIYSKSILIYFYLITFTLKITFTVSYYTCAFTLYYITALAYETSGFSKIACDSENKQWGAGINNAADHLLNMNEWYCCTGRFISEVLRDRLSVVWFLVYCPDLGNECCIEAWRRSARTILLCNKFFSHHFILLYHWITHSLTLTLTLSPTPPFALSRRSLPLLHDCVKVSEERRWADAVLPRWTPVTGRPSAR
jgi:hypothetical protein